jgi:HEPN domain-containing protein
VVEIIRPYLRPDELVRGLGQTYGFVTAEDLIETLKSTHGQEVSEAVASELVRTAEERLSGARGYRSNAIRSIFEDRLRELFRDAANLADEVLAAIPDEWFGTAIAAGRNAAVSAGFDVLDPGGANDAYCTQIESVFERNGVPYRIEGDGLVRTGDPTLATTATQPALDVLGGPGLQDARRHFEAAQADLQRHDPEDAVDEARQAVEAALIAYIEAAEGALPDRHEPVQLFERAVELGLPTEAREMVLGAAWYRGRTRAGHAGRPAVSMDDAEAVVGSAAAAIVFVGRRITSAD